MKGMKKMRSSRGQDRELLIEEIDHMLDEELELLLEASDEKEGQRGSLKYEDRNLESTWC